jgi:hypothetical protein
MRRAFVVIAVIVLMLATIPPGAAGSLLPAITGGPTSETSPGGS